MTDSQHPLREPTPGQLSYLKDLAERAGESFAYPASFEHASAQIERLRSREPTPARERRRERLAISRELAAKRPGQFG